MDIDYLENISYIVEPFDIGNCSFLARQPGYSTLTQYIKLDSFSVLVNSGQAGYNISAYTGCYNGTSNNVTIYVTFRKDNFSILDRHQGEVFQ